MRIGTSAPPSLENLPVDTQIDAELMSKEMEQQKIEAEASARLVEAAAVGINMPLREGPVGRRINIRI
jgi:hypothetical protein